MVCVILFIANRVAPAFQFCLDNSTVPQANPIRYSFFLLSHIIVTPKKAGAKAPAFFLTSYTGLVYNFMTINLFIRSVDYD